MIEKRKVTKIFALLITLGVLVTLIISAPASAYILRLDLQNKNITKGEKVNFTATVQIEEQDRASVTSLQLKLSGPVDINCEFKPDGQIIHGCSGLTIKRISDCSMYSGYNGYKGYSGYSGYSGYDDLYSDCLYGYYGASNELKYNITYDSGMYFAGVYETSLSVMSNNNVIDTIEGDNLKVVFSGFVNQTSYCSIRAKNGEAEVNGTNFGNTNKINFYLPQKGARPGEGYITGQKGRTTFSYKFTITDVLERDNDHTVVATQGKYKIGIGKEIEERALLILDKANGRLDVIGKKVSIEYMDVNFENGGC